MSLPYLSRTLQRLIESLLVLVVVIGFVHGAGLPFSLLAAVIVGWGAAAVAHLAFGTPLGVPSSAEVVATLADLDIDPVDVSPVPHQQWGLTRFTATDADHGPIRISLYSRDARQSQLFRKLYQHDRLPADSAPFSWTRVQQIEHEAYMTLMAERAAPQLTSRLIATEVVGPSREAVVVTTSPSGDLFPPSSTGVARPPVQRWWTWRSACGSCRQVSWPTGRSAWIPSSLATITPAWSTSTAR